MADERPPGPSPAYDQFRPPSTPQPGQQGQTPQGPPIPQGPNAQPPQPGGPVRHPDGSWTVEVHPSPGAGQAPGAYPQPRKPMTQPVPIQAPASGVAPPPTAPRWQGAPPQSPPPQGQQPAYGQQQGFPPPQQRKGPRLGLILGISIPVAVLLILGIVAAILVPNVLRDRDAQAAADDYAVQQEEWASVYSEAALQPLAELDLTAFDAGLLTIAGTAGSGSYTEDATADTSGFQAACDSLASLQGQAAVLSATPPSLRVVDGGESNADYAAALADATASQARYDASGTLAETVTGPFQTIAGSCALVAAQAEAHAGFVTAHQAYLATLTVPNGGMERFDVNASQWIEFTCLAADGCASFVDRNARATSGNAWDAAYVTYNEAMAQTYRDHCPSADVQASCDAWAGMHDQSAQLAASVGAAYRDEDVTGGAAFGGDTTPAPDLLAAVDAFIDGEEANTATARQQSTDATGSSTIFQAIDALVRREAQTIRDAAAVVRG